MRKIADTPTEFQLGDTAADIQRRREEREAREREDEAQKQREETTSRGGWKACKDKKK